MLSLYFLKLNKQKCETYNLRKAVSYHKNTILPHLNWIQIQIINISIQLYSIHHEAV